MTETDVVIEIIERGSRGAMTDEEIALYEVKAWEESEERKRMLEGQRYYNGDSEILKRERQIIGEGGRPRNIEHLANNKLVHNFLRKLVDQKVGYLLSKPMSIQTNNENYESELSKYFNRSMLRTIQNLGKQAIIKGKAWLHVYYNEHGELAFKSMPSEQIIPLWKDSDHTELGALIRVYEVEEFDGKDPKVVKKVEWWDTEGVKRYVLDNGKLIEDVEQESSGHFFMVDGENKQPQAWERIPFICFKYNFEETPLIKSLKSLIDDYDKQKSSNANSLEDLPKSIYVVKNYDGEKLEEFVKNINELRAAKVTGDGGVETLSINIDTEAYRNHMEMNRKDIYEFGRGVDTQSKDFGNSPTGVALRFLYADLDMDANIIETEFQASLDQLRWFIDKHIQNTTGADYSAEQVDFIFNRDIIINETEAITNARDSVGVLSDETIVANHPWTTNTKDELVRKKNEATETDDDNPLSLSGNRQ